MALYRCSFCRRTLIPDAYRWFEFPLALLFVRPYVCPHCFDGYYRPIRSMKDLVGAQKRDNGGHGKGADWVRSTAATEAGVVDGRVVSQTAERPPRSEQEPDGSSHREDRIRGGRSESSRRTSSSSSQRVETPEHDASESDHERRASSRRRSSSRSGSGSRSSEAVEHKRKVRDVRRRDTTLAALSGQRRPSTYASASPMGRLFRRLKRKLKKLIPFRSKSKYQGRHSR